MRVSWNPVLRMHDAQTQILKMVVYAIAMVAVVSCLNLLNCQSREYKKQSNLMNKWQ